jgi:hypothetical protein
MTEEQRQAISKQGDLRLADLPNDVLADASRWRIGTVLEHGFPTVHVGDEMLLPLCLGVAIVGALALYGSFPWIERVYDRWRHRRIVEAQKNRWN